MNVLATLQLLFAVDAPAVEYGPMMPFFVLAGGAILTLFVSLAGGNLAQRVLTPAAAVATLVVAGDLFVRRFGEQDYNVLSGTLSVDDLALVFDCIFIAAALIVTVIVWRSPSLREVGRGEFYSLLITSVLGMALLVSVTDLVALFLAFELLSIPLYVLCASDLRRNGSLESGLKYLIIGSLASAVMLYGMALIYGATAATGFGSIGRMLAETPAASDPVLLVGVGLLFVGLAFKASVAPFHQWTPDVYEGAPTPVTAFMSVATKAAVLALMLRLSAEALAPIRDNWAVVLAALACVTIVVGNVGALRQQSLKRMLAYSGVAQVGYLLVGVVVGTGLGAAALIFYLMVYTLMNLGPFAVIVARERAGAGDGLRGMRGLGREAPLLAWPMTICMIALAGLPITGGFVGKVMLVQAAVFGDWAWLGVAIVIGSAISLGYYLRVVAAIWMPEPEPAAEADPAVPVLAGAAPEADASSHPELVGVAVLSAALVVAIGVYPQWLLDLAYFAGKTFIRLGG